MIRVICLGNRFAAGDEAGPRVYDRLMEMGPPAGIEIVDGGLGGLNLLPLLEGARRVVFVDAVSGFAPPGETVVLTADRVAGLADGSFGHEAGLPYLLRVAPQVCDDLTPEIFVVGLEGPVTGPVDRAADQVLRVALEGAGSGSEALEP